ncbi:hypothetical protein BLL52_1605 [Rhodoferax antarcticus ANT.BR]|uniref:Uncharacterized protein n=2 Tax=Rhodoferax antarcticus TaxID=81479 RepID=A0A1Q8YG22_9BURK|nr:hypothetical protein BLL52_1605 [Rhodoferax antarcticus ANT.BR]
MVNKAVIMMRNWVSDLDRDALPAVRQGEQALRDKYIKALEDSQVSEHPSIFALLKSQQGAIETEIARLPKE